MQPKFHVRRDDTVIVIAGKDKGKVGRVLRVFPKRERVIVEGVNIVKKHVRARPPEVQGGIVEVEAPIHVSNVMVYCARCQKGVRVGKRILEDGSKVRYCKKCNEIIGRVG